MRSASLSGDDEGGDVRGGDDNGDGDGVGSGDCDGDGVRDEGREMNLSK